MDHSNHRLDLPTHRSWRSSSSRTRPWNPTLDNRAREPAMRAQPTTKLTWCELVRTVVGILCTFPGSTTTSCIETNQRTRTNMHPSSQVICVALCSATCSANTVGHPLGTPTTSHQAWKPTVEPVYNSQFPRTNMLFIAPGFYNNIQPVCFHNTP